MTDDRRSPHDPDTSGPGEPESALRRLLKALTTRASRAQVVVAVLLCVLGVAATTQIRLTRSTNDFAGQRREDLVDLLDSLSSATDRARSQLDELEQTRSDLESSTQRRSAVIDEATNRLEVLGILNGTIAATGPGVVVTIEDPRGSVTAATVLNGVEELRDAGAEAIEINDQVRVVASTAFVEGDGEIRVDEVSLRPPYIIDAIGASHTLSTAMVFRGGLSDDVAREGGTATVREADSVDVMALHELRQPEYAQPTDQ